MEIIQNHLGCFMLKNGSRSIAITYQQAEFILPNFYDLDYDIHKAKEYY
jgi:hypothetical protein